jgi:hypothetical protein
MISPAPSRTRRGARERGRLAERDRVPAAAATIAGTTTSQSSAVASQKLIDDSTEATP